MPPARARCSCPPTQTRDLPEGVIASPHGVIELRGFPRPVDGGRPGRHAHACQRRNDTGELWTRSPFLA